MPRPRIEWAARARPLPGEERCGDLHLVHHREDAVVVAVIDGLGHGAAAAEVSLLAADALKTSTATEPKRLLLETHDRLSKTRGAAMSVARVGAQGSLRWAGVGNVDAVAVSPTSTRVWLRQENGIVGHRVQRLEEQSITVAPGTRLILTTDGIHQEYLEALPRGSVEETAEHILAHHARPDDDALVLVLEYWGDAA